MFKFLPHIGRSHILNLKGEQIHFQLPQIKAVHDVKKCLGVCTRLPDRAGS